MHHSEHDTHRAVTDNTPATVSRPAPPFPPTTPERRPSYFEHFSRGRDLTVAFRGGSTATDSTPPFWNRRAAALGAALSFAFMLPYNRSLGLVLRAGRAGRAARNELSKGTAGMPEDGRSSHLVLVGSSAGGVKALSEMVSTLPGDQPVPIVIAQHLDPDRESNLEGILSRCCPLTVRTVVDEDGLQAGVVFVVPANRYVSITDSRIGLQEDGDGR